MEIEGQPESPSEPPNSPRTMRSRQLDRQHAAIMRTQSAADRYLSWAEEHRAKQRQLEREEQEQGRSVSVPAKVEGPVLERGTGRMWQSNVLKAPPPPPSDQSLPKVPPPPAKAKADQAVDQSASVATRTDSTPTAQEVSAVLKQEIVPPPPKRKPPMPDDPRSSSVPIPKAAKAIGALPDDDIAWILESVKNSQRDISTCPQCERSWFSLCLQSKFVLIARSPSQ